MNRLLRILLIVILEPLACQAQLVPVQPFAPRCADTIILERNWRTRDRIILSELEFAPGDTVNPENLALSLKKIWNLQNFASVDYRWDSLPDGRSALILTARDGLTITPILAGNLEFPLAGTLKFGLADRNFLGRNIRLEGRFQLAVYEPMGMEIKLTIPRQLMWKNMSVSAGYRFSQVLFRDFYQTAFVSVVNPFHEDYRYTFSPDLETGYLRNAYKPLYLINGELDPNRPYRYDYRFWYVRVSESVGTITHRRHQEEGYCIAGTIGTGIGLSDTTKGYVEASLRAEYHKIFHPRLQFSAILQGFYHSSPYESLWMKFGPGNIRGIRYGDLSGPLTQIASTSIHYTWLNWEWLTIEQSLFVQYAAAMPSWGDWSGIRHQYAVGTGFHFTMPMYPSASVYVSFCINPNLREWFYLEL
ncbi:MAG: hypothetical protein V2A67_07225 [Bacteroidota bacterium]